MKSLRCFSSLRAAGVAALLAGAGLLSVGALAPSPALAAETDESPVIPSAAKRFATEKIDETPDFGRHIVPLFGRLGCNGRSCHGSFQGQGGFRLSLFGYDPKADHEALFKGDEPRTSLKEPAKSAILEKPTLAIPHEGGERMKVGSWEHRALLRWIEAGGAAAPSDAPSFVRLDVTPHEINFAKKGDVVRLQAIAVWEDGRREDVTPLCRFQTNDETVATINADGVVTGVDPGDTHVVAFYDKAVVPIPTMRPISDRVGPKYPKTPTPTEVDRLVVSKLQKLGIVQSDLCTDAEFLRRVSLDITGTLPTAQEVEAFLADSTSDKRDRKIDELLERPAYAAWWTTLFCDWTGNNPQQLNNIGVVNGQPAKEWYEWVQKRFAENMPYDQLVAGVVLAAGRKPDQSYADYCKEMSEMYGPEKKGSPAERETMPYFWARRNLRQPEEKALAFAYSFMGIRIQCAQCHKHPFDVWTQDDYKQFQNFFTRIGYGVAPDVRKEQQQMLADLGVDQKKGGNNDIRKQLPQLLKEGKVVPFEEPYVAKAGKNDRPGRNKNPDKQKKNPRATFAQSARVLGGDLIELSNVDDPRLPLMDWLKSSENPYFAKAIVNRVWATYFSVGIVEPADDLSLANPPSNRALLDYLAEQFVEHKFDLKWLHREIARSRAYQLSWVPNDTNKLDTRNFARAVPRRMPAEVAYDAVRQAVSSDAEVASLQANVGRRAIGGGFPQPGKNGGDSNAYALTVFGRSSRDSNCDCDRSMEASLLQTVFLRNDQSVLQMIEGEKNGWASQVTPNPKAKPDEVAAANSGEKTSDDGKPEGKANRKARQFLVEMRRDIARVEEKLKAAEKEGDEEKTAALKTKLENVRKEFVQAQKKTELANQENRRKGEGTRRKERDKETAEASAAPLSPEAIVRQAYLRSLSRNPDEGEMKTSLEYLSGATSLRDGAEGLLWALVNTKEFIVNH